jgi:RNA polymerase sigma-70 factor (ECF subfamily)
MSPGGPPRQDELGAFRLRQQQHAAARISAIGALGDDELVALILPRDDTAEAALATLYDRYASSVYGLGMRMFGDRGRAEDLLQETFYRLWLNAAHYEAGRARFATWLLRVATNLGISELRRTARRPALAARSIGYGVPGERDGAAAVDPADPDPDVPDQVWLREQRRLIQDGLAELPAEQRQAVELAYYAGMTHAEIAAAQGAPLSTVKTRLALGLRKLGSFLQARGVSSRDEDHVL